LNNLAVARLPEFEANGHRQFVQDLPGFGNGECKVGRASPTISNSEGRVAANRLRKRLQLIAEEKTGTLHEITSAAG